MTDGDSLPLVRCDRVELGYAGRAILPPLDLTIRRGDFWGLVGPNGSGKTTLIRTLLGLIPTVRGRVHFDATEGNRPRMGYVAQRDTVDFSFPLSVAEVVLMGRAGRIGSFRHARRADRDFARSCISLAGIAHLERRPFNALSGGEKQRALVARALAGEPDILVLDEPTNGMDLAGERGIMDLIGALNKERHLTVLFVSHQLHVVGNYVHDLCIVHRDEQRFCVGPVAEILDGATLSDLYKRPVVVWEHRGHRSVFIDRHDHDTSAPPSPLPPAPGEKK